MIRLLHLAMAAAILGGSGCTVLDHSNQLIANSIYDQITSQRHQWTIPQTTRFFVTYVAAPTADPHPTDSIIAERTASAIAQEFLLVDYEQRAGSYREAIAMANHRGAQILVLPKVVARKSSQTENCNYAGEECAFYEEEVATDLMISLIDPVVGQPFETARIKASRGPYSDSDTLKLAVQNYVSRLVSRSGPRNEWRW